MKKSNFKRLLSCTLVIVMLAMTFAGCSKKPAPTTTGNAEATKAPVKKTKVTFWYLWGGDTVKTIDAMVKNYNDQSDKYEVEALSVPDSQKIMAAISAGNGPDVTDDFNGNIGKFVSAGIMEPLDDYIAKTNYDTPDFIPAALDACKMDGKTYALPLNINFSGLYYNKKLLKEAGYTEPPKTMEEMYEMAVKTTKVNKDGTLDVCGFPDFPKVYYLGAFATGAGGSWFTKDGKAAPADSYGNKFALKLMRDYRQKFGLENVTKFESGGKYLDPTDPFLMGKQTFRIDGPWMGKSIKVDFKSDVDYGVTYVPYPKDKPELKASALVSSSILFVTSNSKNKEGAFDFISYVAGKQGQIDFTIKSGDFPSRMSLLTNENFLKGFDSAFYAELGKSTNLVTTPNGPNNGEYNTYVSEQTELCMNLKQDIDTTLQNIYKKGMELLK